jgi:hypothetical protein
MTYRLGDFLLFSRGSYLRLFERFNESLYPAQYLVYLAALLGLVMWLRSGRFPVRPALLGFSLAYALVGYGFIWRLYAPINWLTVYLLPLVGLQALLLVILALRYFAWAGQTASRLPWPFWALWMLAIIASPAVEWMVGRQPAEISWFLLAPDTLAVATLGLLAVADRRWWWGGAAVVWLVFSALTLLAMESWEALLPVVAVLTWLLALRVSSG